MPDLRNPGANGLAFMWKWHDVIDQSDKWTIPAEYILDDGTYAAIEMNNNAYPFSFSPAYERQCAEWQAEANAAAARGERVFILDEFDNKENYR